MLEIMRVNPELGLTAMKKHVMDTNRQTDRQTDRQTGKQINGAHMLLDSSTVHT